MGDKSFHQRFVEAKNGITNPALDGINPHFGNRYASLRETLNTIRKSCLVHEISYCQELRESDGKSYIYSYVMDGDNTRIEMSSFPIDVPPNPQSFASNLTYIKRQQAQLDWGITGEDDDDAEAASGRSETPVEAALARLRQELIDWSKKSNGDLKEASEQCMESIINYIDNIADSYKQAS